MSLAFDRERLMSQKVGLKDDVEVVGPTGELKI